MRLLKQEYLLIFCQRPYFLEAVSGANMYYCVLHSNNVVSDILLFNARGHIYSVTKQALSALVIATIPGRMIVARQTK